MSHQLTIQVCGTKLCKDGKPHDDLGFVAIKDESGRSVGAMVACSRCGSTALGRAMLKAAVTLPKVAVCPSCGEVNQAGWKVCWKCKRQLGEATGA